MPPTNVSCVAPIGSRPTSSRAACARPLPRSSARPAKRAFLVTGVTDIAADYVRTLRWWREAFLDRVDEVRGLGFDERFVRMWEYYLALSEAGFATGLSQDLQIVMEKSRGFDRDPGP